MINKNNNNINIIDKNSTNMRLSMINGELATSTDNPLRYKTKSNYNIVCLIIH